MPAGDLKLLAQGFDTGRHGGGCISVSGQITQPPSGCRCEGYCCHQFGVVTQAHTLPRVRPGPVKNVLAVAVVFQIRGQYADRRAALLKRDMRWLPAALGSGAGRGFQPVQEAPVQKRIAVTKAGLPQIGVELGDGPMQFGVKGVHRAQPALAPIQKWPQSPMRMIRPIHLLWLNAAKHCSMLRSRIIHRWRAKRMPTATTAA